MVVAYSNWIALVAQYHKYIIDILFIPDIIIIDSHLGFSQQPGHLSITVSKTFQRFYLFIPKVHKLQHDTCLSIHCTCSSTQRHGCSDEKLAH